MKQIPRGLKGLAKCPQFLLFRLVQNAKTGRLDKIPLNPYTLTPHDAHDATIWIDFEAAKQLSQQHGLGVAFTFTESDDYFFIDVDDCINEQGI